MLWVASSSALFISSLLSLVCTSHLHQQVVLGDGEVMSTIAIIDELPSHRNIQVFTSLIRDVQPISKLLSGSSRRNFTILAPTNAAMVSLPHKPWEDSVDYKLFGNEAYEGDTGQARAQKNIQAFVEAHILPKAPWTENDKTHSLAGSDGDGQSNKILWWEDSGDGARIISPDGVKVESVAATGSNGEIWIISGTLKS